jgi:hypothetical protein
MSSIGNSSSSSSNRSPSQPPSGIKAKGFTVGDRVVLCGLNSASYLNGRHGHIGYKPVDDQEEANRVSFVIYNDQRLFYWLLQMS